MKQVSSFWRRALSAGIAVALCGCASMKRTPPPAIVESPDGRLVPAQLDAEASDLPATQPVVKYVPVAALKLRPMFNRPTLVRVGADVSAVLTVARQWYRHSATARPIGTRRPDGRLSPTLKTRRRAFSPTPRPLSRTFASRLFLRQASLSSRPATSSRLRW